MMLSRHPDWRGDDDGEDGSPATAIVQRRNSGLLLRPVTLQLGFCKTQNPNCCPMRSVFFNKNRTLFFNVTNQVVPVGLEPFNQDQNMTSEEAWSGHKPAVDHFRIFGCIAFAHIPDQKRSKLDDKFMKCIFLGVSENSKAYRKDISAFLVWEGIIYNDEEAEANIHAHVDTQVAVGEGSASDGSRVAIDTITTGTSTNPIITNPISDNSSQEGRAGRLPVWMEDYETGEGLSEEEVFTNLAMFVDRDPVLFASVVKCLKMVRDENGVKVDGTMYKQIVGSLMYLIATRPDIVYSVNLISRFMEHPTQLHLVAAKRILRYLKGTLGFGMFYKKGGKLKLIGYTDSDYAGDVEDRKRLLDTCSCSIQEQFYGLQRSNQLSLCLQQKRSLLRQHLVHVKLYG
ncbi:hypothetical protein MRB53_002558 [Persea americana]|uniref:Uncharacterized protein n=1 Tax=Persea americana TaxID=3435 RepID=A0ACC2MVT2_PERAE|nr:hypothetical protein MRB53_002558 [Persea americana]